MPPSPASTSLTLFLCGDVMTGRGVDQILPQRPVGYDYVWGAGLEELRQGRPDLSIINLETSVTADGVAEPKGINYRMHPGNIACLAAAGVDCCVLANNHVLDWGEAGLLDTIGSLRAAGFATAGAGRNLSEAETPALFDVQGGRRVRVHAFATPSSGVPEDWAAAPQRPGVCLLRDLSERSFEAVRNILQRDARPGDVTVVSLHWGGNWGYDIPDSHRHFAHALIDRAGAHVVHGHSSHHPKAIELHRGKLILYGCGDLINDYEGIGGHEDYRADLVLMYFVRLDPTSGDLLALEMVPLRLHRFSLERPSHDDVAWLAQRLARECARFGTAVRLRPGDVLELHR
jgi:poly-gamma-glutamate synthesis protein (capsule biosynthesis protein)